MRRHSKWAESSLPPTPDVGDGTDTPQVLHEDDPGHTEGGGEGDIEPPVTVEVGGVSPVQLNTLTQRHSSHTTHSTLTAHAQQDTSRASGTRLAVLTFL